MEGTILISALRLVLWASLPVLGAILSGALVMGVLRVATQIDEALLGFLGRFGGLAMFFYLASGQLTGRVLEFAARLWGGSDFYH